MSIVFGFFFALVALSAIGLIVLFFACDQAAERETKRKSNDDNPG